MKYAELTQLYFDRSNALQWYWTIYVLVIGGLLMLMLGIIGEYVWRIYDEVKGKPNYVVRQIY